MQFMLLLALIAQAPADQPTDEEAMKRAEREANEAIEAALEANRRLEEANKRVEEARAAVAAADAAAAESAAMIAERIDVLSEYSRAVFQASIENLIENPNKDEADRLIKMRPYLPRIGLDVAFKPKSLGILIGEGKVLQVPGKTDLLVSYTPLLSKESTTIWIADIDTTDYFDDKELSLLWFANTVWLVAGTHSYTTVTGAKKTVLLIGPYLTKETVTKHVEKFDFVSAEQRAAYLGEKKSKAANQSGASKCPKRVAPTKQAYPYRTWRSGRFQVEARFAGLIGDTVTLERKDNGIKVKIPRGRLSEDDQDYIESLR